MKNLLSALLLLISLHCFSQDTITTVQVKDYMDQLVCVKGKVASFKLASEGKNINYINIDKAYPESVFSVILTNAHLAKLNIKIEELEGKSIYIKGTINTYKNDPKQTPQIYNPISIEVAKD
jgi:exonuclease VII large subunit